MMELLSWVILVAVVYILVQLTRLVFADGDLTLLWAEKFGKKTAELAGKVVWITGASSGIGEHLAYELAKASCKLILSARREGELNRVKKQCLLCGPLSENDVLVLALDMLDVDKHQSAVSQVLEHFKQIDILVNNAGRGHWARVVKTSLEVDRYLLDLNLLSVLSLTKAVLPHMVEKKQGHIVCTSSLSGKLGFPMTTACTASKYAIQGWFGVARMELNMDNITVTLVCPGPIVSAAYENMVADKVDKTYEGPLVITQRMATSRCAELIATAIVNKLDEVWVSQQPFLFFYYLFQYMPAIATRLSYRIYQQNLQEMQKEEL